MILSKIALIRITKRIFNIVLRKRIDFIRALMHYLFNFNSTNLM